MTTTDIKLLRKSISTLYLLPIWLQNVLLLVCKVKIRLSFVLDLLSVHYSGIIIILLLFSTAAAC